MSLKNVELQIAIPRTQDLGKQQHELQQRSQVAQDQITVANESELYHNQHRVISHHTTNKSNFKSDHQTRTREQKSDSNHNKQQPFNKVRHPYKGHTIDYSG